MVDLRDLLINARQESQQMRHHFIGVEHLCIAMLRVRDGIFVRVLSSLGLSVEYVVEALRRRVGKGGRHRLWSGVPNTPRVEVILTLAQDICHEDGRTHISERDLLLAILEEGDSLALRVLVSLGVELASIQAGVLEATSNSASQPTFVNIEFAPGFTDSLAQDVLYLLRNMFSSFDRVRIEAALHGGHSGALLLMATPIRDSQEHATVVVKIGQADAILDEAQRFERYIRTTLPPLTARIEERPVSPQLTELVGIQYTLAGDGAMPRSLRTLVATDPLDGFDGWLRTMLYETYAPRWWGQRRAYRFEAWQEYDAMLPPFLEIDMMEPDTAPDSAVLLRYPLRRSRLAQLQYGNIVRIESFIVYRIDRSEQRLTLALGHGNTRAFQIAVRGVNLDSEAYFRGELVETVVGRVVRTRHDMLMAALSDLNPDFDPRDALLPLGTQRIPNPFMRYQAVLDHPVIGTISVLHGDLHLGNIIMGVRSTAMLIDFAQAREGHTLLDWANLEISLTAELFAPYLDQTWRSVRLAAAQLASLTRESVAPPPVRAALLEVRRIVNELLAVPNRWEEYFVALAIVCLRATQWSTMSVPQRRLMTYAAGLAIRELDHREPGTSPDVTEFPDLTR